MTQMCHSDRPDSLEGKRIGGNAKVEKAERGHARKTGRPSNTEDPPYTGVRKSDLGVA